MIYPLFKVLHLAGVVVWVGGMFFALVFLHPAARSALGVAERLRLVQAVQRRFLDGIAVAIVVILASGSAMLGMAWRAASASALPFNVPLDWYAMVGGFVLMLLVFLHVRLALFPRATRAVEAGAHLDAARWMDRIRAEMLANLALGFAIVAVVGLGGSA